MRVLFDTNVVLDVLLDRQPHAIAASRVMVYVEQGRIAGLLCATSVTTSHYLATNAVGTAPAKKHLRTLFSLFEVAPVGLVALLDALHMKFGDYEDAVLHEAARHSGATGIVTRDQKGFVNATMRIYSERAVDDAAGIAAIVANWRSVGAGFKPSPTTAVRRAPMRGGTQTASSPSPLPGGRHCTRNVSHWRPTDRGPRVRTYLRFHPRCRPPERRGTSRWWCMRGPARRV